MENKRTEAKSSYHVGGMSIVFVQLVLSVLFLVLAKENGMIPENIWCRSGQVFWCFLELRLVYSF